MSDPWADDASQTHRSAGQRQSVLANQSGRFAPSSQLLAPPPRRRRRTAMLSGRSLQPSSTPLGATSYANDRTTMRLSNARYSGMTGSPRRGDRPDLRSARSCRQASLSMQHWADIACFALATR